VLGKIQGVRIQEDPTWGHSNAWLTVIRISTDVHPDGSAKVREYLEARNVESRPVWKPMHQQPIFEDNPTFLTGTADALYREGLCLPSGTQLRMQDVDAIAGMVSDALTNR
jgi:dTDP-4-amino-4,6-dideoxygalactose transaminase